MDEKTKQILNDLYMIDGSLKKHEKEVTEIVNKLLESKPDIKVDGNFVRELRMELVKRAKVMNAIEPAKQGFWTSVISGRKLAYSLTAVVMVLAAIASVSYFFGQTGNNTPGGQVAVISDREINKVKDNAFGSLLSDQSKAPVGLGGGTGAPVGAGTGLGGGGGIPTEGTAGGKSIVGPYGMVNYHYIYKGGDFSTPEDKVTVYKRIKEIPQGDNITSILGRMNFGLVDLGKFSDARVGNLTVSEDREYGYDITLDFKEGSIFINQNWMKWPNPLASCRDQACYESNQLKESDIPSKDFLITTADKFLSDYGIDKSAYGEPQVIESYGWLADNVGRKTLQVPEVISVVYPLEINGQESYDQAGNPDGMVVDINIRFKKAVGVRNIFSQKFESSNYDAETDKSKLISFAQGGGMNGNYGYPEAQKTIEVDLGTPKVGLVMTWKWEQTIGGGYFLYIPAYIFPVTKTSEDVYLPQKNVIVPMAKEALWGQIQGGGVKIMEPFTSEAK